MRFPPPEIVASWPPPNYINPVSRGPTLLIVEFITLSIALLCLGMRMYVRLHIMRKSGWDDWLMVGSAVFGTGVTTCVVLAFVRYGWAIHVWDLTPSKMIAGRQVSFAAQALFVPATSLAKVSILVNYYRLAPRNSWFHHMIVASMVFVVVLNIIFLIILFTECIPVSSYWNLLLYDRDCVSEAETLLAQASTTAIADFVVWVLPMPWLYRAKLPLRQRLAVIALFSFGLFVVIAACIRAYWIHYIVQKTYDVTWYGFHLWMWTAVEVHLGIICACVPWIKSLYKFNTNKRNVTEVEEITDKAGESSCQNSRETQIEVVKIEPVGEEGECWEGSDKRA
ncbi:hypothetical protein P885DRAFT_71762 [Corynascus similis CBS 632.67]